MFALGNPDGFTIDPRDRECPKSGFAVAVEKEKEFVIPGIFNHADIVELVSRYVRANAIHISLNDGLMVGGWRDSETGNYVLDLVMVLPADKRDEAVALGMANNQKAIYSLHDKEEIFLS